MKNILDYSQPEFYHFSEESLELIYFAKVLLKGKEQLKTAIDIGTGCGVIGIEALSKLPQIRHMTFLELQEEFLFHLKENLNKAEITDAAIIQCSLGNFEGCFDLIFSNPPYFIPGEGRVSKQNNRQLCRTFEVDGWEVFFKKVSELLKPNGLIFFCVKEEGKIERFLTSFKLIKKEKTKAATLFCLARLDID